MRLDTKSIKTIWRCKCPKCEKGNLYKSSLTIELNTQCPNCALNFNKSDAADGPAVFLIFVLGALLVPLAITLEFALSPPLWLHVILWGSVALILTLAMLRPIKSYVIALQYKHRPEMFN